MTTRECEDRLLALADEMLRVYKEYTPAGDCLTVSIMDGVVSIDDRLKNEAGDYTSVTNGFDRSATIYVHRNKDGDVSRTDFWRRIWNDINRGRESA